MSNFLDDWPAFPIGRIVLDAEGKKKFPDGLPKAWQETKQLSKDISGNAGLVPGSGRVVIDIDESSQAEQAKSCLYKLPITATQKTQSGMLQGFFLCPDAPEGNAIFLTKDGEAIGELRKGNAFVVRPGSRTEQGTTWEMLNSQPVASVPWADIEKAFAEFAFDEKTHSPKEAKNGKKDEQRYTAAEILRMKHPTEKQRCGCAVKIYKRREIKGEDSSIDAICKEIAENTCWEDYSPEFTRTKIEDWLCKYFKLTPKELAAKEEKEKEKEKEKIEKEQAAAQVDNFEIPTSDFVDFSEIKKVFQGTHTHLPLYPLIDAELGFDGNEYYAVKKALSYLCESGRQEVVCFRVGKEYSDNRLHIVFVAPQCGGKGVIKNLLGYCPDSAEISGGAHQEQLIGKIIAKGRGKNRVEKEVRGYFDKKLLKVDEAQHLIQEEDKNASDLMRLYRIAADTFGRNRIEKKLVDNEIYLNYNPETRFVLFMHPLVLPPVFFDTGTARRFFCFSLKAKALEENDAVKNLFAETKTEELREKMQQKIQPFVNLQLSEDAVKEVAEWIKALNCFLLNHENQRVRALGEMFFFTTKNYFLRTVAILGIIQKNEQKIPIETAKQACFDCVQFLLETAEFYCNNSRITLSRDVWHTEDGKAALLLEWMWMRGAKDEESTPLKIWDVQEQTGDIFGMNERQARSVFNQLKKDGLICAKQTGAHGSKAWLGFTPDMRKIATTSQEPFKDFLARKRQEIEGGKGGNQ